MPARVIFENYSTVRSAKAFERKDRIGFFEIKIDEIQLLQLGFVTEKFQSKMESDGGDVGVGDDENGWGWDGSRNCIWNGGSSEEIPNVEWSDGDVLGFLGDFDRNVCSLFQNGELKHSFIFSSNIDALFPAFTGYGSSIRVYWRNGFAMRLPKEVVYPNCIMCDKRHACQPCIFINEDEDEDSDEAQKVCSMCDNPIASGSYGTQCRPCGFFCCSNCDAESSIYYKSRERRTHEACCYVKH